MKYLIYARKSSESEERQVLSIPAQLSELKDIAEKEEYEVAKIFEESMSAKASGRPLFNQMLELIQKGKGYSLLVWNVDRLARNMVDGGMLLELMDQGKILEIRTYERTYRNTPDDKFMMSLYFGMAKKYVDDLSVNVKRGNLEKLKRGDWTSRAPFGYSNNKATKTIAVDTVRAPYVHEMFELYSTGLHSSQDISNLLYEKGLRSSSGKKIYKSGVQKIINSRFYTGIMEANGNEYLGNHEPLVSTQLFEKCKEVSDKKARRTRPKTLSFTLSGFMTCANCGCAITAELKKNKYIYYHCTNGKGICDQRSFNANETELHKQITLDLKKLKISPRMIDIVYKAKLEELEHSKGTGDHALEDAQKALKLLATRKSRLVDTYTEGDIDTDLYRAKLREIDNENVRLTKRIADLEKEVSDPLATIELIYSKFKEGISLSERYKAVEPSERRIILSEALSNSTLLNRNIAEIQYKSPYNIFALAPLNPTFSEMLAGSV
ncbi:MAG: recombinase family protein [Candidatus Paceibacterota bacterium]